MPNIGFVILVAMSLIGCSGTQFATQSEREAPERNNRPASPKTSNANKTNNTGNADDPYANVTFGDGSDGVGLEEGKRTSSDGQQIVSEDNAVNIPDDVEIDNGEINSDSAEEIVMEDGRIIYKGFCAGGKEDRLPSYALNSKEEAIECARQISQDPRGGLCFSNAAWGRCEGEKAGWQITSDVDRCSCIPDARINELPRTVAFTDQVESP